jgi:RNA polymerase sigma-70 factor (ECF subfamily)
MRSRVDATDSSMSSPGVDGALVARIAAGDETALAHLYDALGGLAYSLARAILHDPAESEEAVADAFLQVWTTAKSFDGSRASVAAWVTMIVRTRALDRLRSRKRRTMAVEKAAGFDAEGVAIPIGDPGPEPDRFAELAEVRQRVAGVMAELSPPQRRAIELAFFQGLSHSEIAEALGEPLGTVKTRIRAGMEKLRAGLASYIGVE